MQSIEKIKSLFTESKASEDDLKILEEWLGQHPEEKKELYHIKDIYDAYALATNSKRYSTELEVSRLQARLSIAKVPEAPKAPKVIRLQEYLQIAAAVVLSFVLGGLVHYFFFDSFPQKRESLAETRTISVPNGQVNQLFLADGSRIWINSGSTITAPSVFTGDKRTVHLTGEAFFEIAKDTERPFQVVVDGQTIEVLGTSFNVRAYADSKEVQTTLSEGKIKLITPKGFMELLPGQQTELDKTTGEIILNEVKTASFEAWKEGRYEFNNENLVEVFQMVERWYDVELIYNQNDFSTMNFSGVIRRNKPAEHFLTLLEHSIPIRYEVISQDKVKVERIKKK